MQTRSKCRVSILRSQFHFTQLQLLKLETLSVQVC